ncbi:hypothetical protein FACS1894204_06580 [Synergistales bacterium]|nr:hypothetical protein FACS1894204_06580 [Synergistales bacterium]
MKKMKVLARLAMALVIAALVTSSAFAAMPTASAGDAWDGVDFDALLTPVNYIYYGTYSHATSFRDTRYGVATQEPTQRPILWRVMGDEGDNYITVLSEYVIDSRAFHTSSNKYDTSTIRSFLAGKFMDSFTTAEKDDNAMPPVTVTTKTYKYKNISTVSDGTYDSTASNQKVYLPWGHHDGSDSKIYWSANGDLSSASSCSVSSNIAYLKGTTRRVWYWLRSPDSDSSEKALYLYYYNDIEFIGRNEVPLLQGVRPVFKLNPSSVVFISEIVSPGSGDEMGKIDTPSVDDYAVGNYKLTVLGSGGALTGVPTATKIFDKIDVTMPLTLTPSQTTSEYTVNYKIVGDGASGREIVRYGYTSAASSTVTLNLDISSLDNDKDYTVYVWLQKNNAINSNEALALQSFTLSNPDAPADVAVADVRLSHAELTLAPSGAATLIATIEPPNATNRNVSWVSSNEGVAAVSASGAVTAVSPGTATVTVTTEDSNKTAFCAVTVLTASEALAAYINTRTGLNATAAGDTITVSGTPTNTEPVTLITENPNIKIEWNAAYAGNSPSALITVSGGGAIEFGGEANITNGIGGAVASDGDIIIRGGVISAGGGGTAVSTTKNVTVLGGGVSADGTNGRAIYALGNVSATGGAVSSLGIGGVAIKAVGTVTMNGNAVISSTENVTLAPSPKKGILIQGTEGFVYGDVTLNLGFTVPSGATLTIGAGNSLTNKALLINNGTIDNRDGGEIINDQTIRSGGVILNTGGAIYNYGTIDGLETGSIDNTGGVLNDYGAITDVDIIDGMAGGGGAGGRD